MMITKSYGIKITKTVKIIIYFNIIIFLNNRDLMDISLFGSIQLKKKFRDYEVK